MTEDNESWWKVVKCDKNWQKKFKKLERSGQMWQELNDGNSKVCKKSINDVKKW